MTLPGLVLLVFLTSSDAGQRDAGCGDCNESGQWWPLFKPSQIIHSEFPEHGPHTSQKQVQFNSHERSSQDGEPHVVSLENDVGSSGIDSQVKTYNSEGKHRIEWDHYGDVSRVSTVPYNSLESRSGVHSSSEIEPSLAPGTGHVAPPNSLETATVSGEDYSGRREHESTKKDISTPEEDIKSHEGSFFDDEYFFDDKHSLEKDKFPRDFDVSKESSMSNEAHESSNSIELSTSHEAFGRYKKPVATSYSSISSVFAGVRPAPIQSRDLLHPDITYSDVPEYIRGQISIPLSRSRFSNGRNVTNHYLVHEPKQEDPGVFYINHGSGSLPGRLSGRSNQLSSFVPVDHPVYRYVKNHGGLLHRYRQTPLRRSPTLRWQDIHPELRSKFPFRQLQPYVHVQKHETVVHHVIPTKDPFSDSFWKESTNIENIKPPPLEQTLFFFKKKPNNMDLIKNVRRQGHNYIYIIRRNKRLS